MRLKIRHIICLFSASLIIVSCAKDEVTPINPYDDIDNTIQDDSTAIDDSSSIVTIHRDILLPRCSTPGCHDGAFEPDFRTISSSYSTLVYQPIIKNNDSNQFKYRVIPFNSIESVLHERITNCCFVNVNDRMPQDLIGTPLPDRDIERIKDWIEAGAQNYMGDLPVYPNFEPTINNFSLYDASDYPKTGTVEKYSANKFREDTTTGGSKLLLDTGLSVFMIVKIEDDSTAEADLQNVQLNFSLQQDKFESPFKTVAGTYYDASTPKWHFIFDIDNTIPTNTTIYIQVVANDGDHPFNTENPSYISSNYRKRFWSMKIIPGQFN